MRHAVFITLLLLLTGLAVDLSADGRLFGLGMATVALAVTLGAALGVAGGRLITVRTWTGSLARTWNQWMRYSVACARVDEVHRRVRGRPATRSVGALAALWALVLFATVILLLFTVLDGAPALNQTPVFAAYGLYLGYMLGRAVAVRVWVRQFLASVDELMREGRLALWGIV